MKNSLAATILTIAAIWALYPEPEASPSVVNAAMVKGNGGTSSFVAAMSPTLLNSFAYQSSRGVSVQYSIGDGQADEVFNHASGTSDAFFQFTPRSGSDGEFQILVYAGSGEALLTRTYVIPGYAPVITVPPKARVVLKDPIDEDSDSITGLVTIG